MIDTNQVFVADAKPALALPTQRSAYVFGAASALGEALLNQLLASPRYSAVYVSTTAALPGSVAHLNALLASQPFTVQDAAQEMDCVFIANEHAEIRSRNTVYATLAGEHIPTLLRELSNALPSTGVRYLIVAPASSVSEAGAYLASYASQASCMAYGCTEGKKASAGKNAYQFTPQADSLLDRLGVWVLNALSNVAHSMLNPHTGVPLTSVKIAQRLAQRFEALPLQTTGTVSALQPEDLKT